MANSKKTNKWLNKHVKDRYVLESKKMNFSSRAAFKLMSIDKKYQILNKVDHVVDLGCAPGSWCEVLSNKYEIKNIIGIDKMPCGPIKNVQIRQIDINDHDKVREVMRKYNYKFNLVLSDIAPNITGISDVDQGNFYEIASTIEDFCKSRLKLGGTMIMKYFVGSAFDQTLSRLDKNFKKINVFKPESSKKKSNEIYLICMDFDG